MQKNKFIIADNTGKNHGEYRENEIGSAKRRARALLNKGYDVFIAHYNGDNMVGRFEMTWANGWVYFNGPVKDLAGFQAINSAESCINLDNRNRL